MSDVVPHAGLSEQVDDAWDDLFDTQAMRCCDCPSCNSYLPHTAEEAARHGVPQYQPESECVVVAAIKRIILAERAARPVTLNEDERGACHCGSLVAESLDCDVALAARPAAPDPLEAVRADATLRERVEAAERQKFTVEVGHRRYWVIDAALITEALS